MNVGGRPRMYDECPSCKGRLYVYSTLIKTETIKRRYVKCESCGKQFLASGNNRLWTGGKSGYGVIEYEKVEYENVRPNRKTQKLCSV